LSFVREEREVGSRITDKLAINLLTGKISLKFDLSSISEFAYNTSTFLSI